MIEGTAINLKCARCIHCEMCSWIKDVNDGCDWFEEDKEYSYRIELPDNATSVLNAIKLEIKQEYDNQGDWSFNDGLAFALEIIDKYAKENRNENGTLDI